MYEFMGYEIEPLENSIKKTFLSKFRITKSGLYQFEVNKNIRDFILEQQDQLCHQVIYPIPDHLYSSDHSIFNIQPTKSTDFQPVQITISIPRLIRKEKMYYPKVVVSKAKITS